MIGSFAELEAAGEEVAGAGFEKDLVAVDHGGACVGLVEPEFLAGLGVEGADAAGFVLEGVASHAAGFDEDVVLGGIAQPGAEDIVVDCPKDFLRS